METSRIVGALICLGTVLVAGVFIWGIALHSYWAIAIPVIIGALAVLALGFWIGWNMAVTAIEAPAAQPTEEGASSEAKE